MTLRGRSDSDLLRKLRRRLLQAPARVSNRTNRYRARIGDYRIIYTFDLEQNKIHLLAIGHRREIYRDT